MGEKMKHLFHILSNVRTFAIIVVATSVAKVLTIGQFLEIPAIFFFIKAL